VAVRTVMRLAEDLPITAEQADKLCVAIAAAIEADRASRGTGEREAGRREAFEEAAKLLRDSVALAKGANDGPELAAAIARRADERLHCAKDIEALASATTPAPAEPPTGHLELAVRALEEIRD